MSSTQFQVEVQSVAGTWVSLAMRLCGDMPQVFAEAQFAARVLADSLDDDAPRTWLEAHAAEVIVESSLRVHDAQNHPRVVPSIHQVMEPLLAAQASRWETAPMDVIQALAAAAREAGGALQFEAEPDAYRASSLSEVVEEVAALQLERLARVESRATLTFQVKDARWLQHLHPGDRFDSVAYP
jgi:hypothetical protein